MNYFATQLQAVEAIRAQYRAQDEAGVVPANTVDETASADDKRAAMLSTPPTYRPPCGCSPDAGEVPCDAAILSVLSHEPIPGCPNAIFDLEQ
jgi:hypothetical protein